MDTRIFGKSVHHDQPVVALEVDGMVNVNTAPRFVWGDPWMRWLLCRQPLVLVAGSTVSSDVFDVRVDARPVDCTTGQLFHPLHAEMTQVQDLENLGLKFCRDHHSMSIEKTTVC